MIDELQTYHTHHQSSRSQAPHLTLSRSGCCQPQDECVLFYIVITLVIMRLVADLRIRRIRCPPKSGLRVRSRQVLVNGENDSYDQSSLKPSTLFEVEGKGQGLV